MGSLRDSLIVLKEKESAMIQSERMQRVRDQLPVDQSSEEVQAEGELLSAVDALLQDYKALPWYSPKRWWNRTYYGRLQEAFAHLSAEAALETLLKQLDPNDELPLTTEAAAACFQVAAAIAAVRHYDSLWKVGSWWAKRRVERQLKEKGKNMQKQLMTRNKLYRQWQNLIRQLKSEAS